jgi:nucleoside 2-deoxyribosyltransferase
MSDSADDNADDEVSKTPVVPEIDPKPVVYLAGAVQDHPDPVGWREDIIDQFSDRVAFKNPLGRYDCDPDELTVLPGHQDGGDPATVGVADIVEIDKELLDDSDAVFIGFERSHGSVGTPMEVLYAYERDKPVALCIQDDTTHHEIPAWYRYHVTAQVSAPRLALRHLCLEVQRNRTDMDTDTDASDGGGD